MALSEEMKSVWEEIKKIEVYANEIFEKIKTSLILSQLLITEAEGYVDTINSVIAGKHTTDKQVKEIETTVKNAYKNLLRIKEKAEFEVKDGQTNTETETDSEQSDEEIITVVYVGPTLRKFGITRNTNFVGTKKDTYKFFEPIIKVIPDIEKMLIPVSELTEKQKLLNIGNNAFSNIYKKIERKNKEV